MVFNLYEKYLCNDDVIDKTLEFIKKECNEIISIINDYIKVNSDSDSNNMKKLDFIFQITSIMSKINLIEEVYIKMCDPDK